VCCQWGGKSPDIVFWDTVTFLGFVVMIFWDTVPMVLTVTNCICGQS